MRLRNLSQNDIFKYQNTLYRLVDPVSDEHDDCLVQRICVFWAMGRGGKTSPTWVYSNAPNPERFKADSIVETIEFIPVMHPAAKPPREQQTASNIDGDPFHPQTD